MNTNSVVVAFPKEKQVVPSALEQAKGVYEKSVQGYLEQCRMFAACPNLRATVHHQQMVEASNKYLQVLSGEVASQKSIFRKVFTFVKISGERAQVAKLRHMAQKEADKPQF